MPGPVIGPGSGRDGDDEGQRDQGDRNAYPNAGREGGREHGRTSSKERLEINRDYTTLGSGLAK